jgi:putative ABC transport system permease protein
MVTFFRKLRSIFGGARRDAEIREELEFHLEQEAADARAAGLSDEGARRAARRDLGNVALVGEDARAAWGWAWLEQLRQDLGYAGRMMRRRPSFTACAILSLALGIGANAAIFGLLHALLFAELPVRRPAELVQLVEAREGSILERFIYANAETLRQNATRLVSVAAAYAANENEIVLDGARHRAIVQLVSDSYFDVLGVDAAAGRVFHALAPGEAGEPIAVISDGYWRRRFNAEPVLGRSFTIGRHTTTITGIAPPAFRGIELEAAVDIWVRHDQVVPAGSVDRTRGRASRIFGRLAEGADARQATAEASALLGRPVTFAAGGRPYSSLRSQLYRPMLLVTLVVVLVLLITCTNLANLTFAANLARERELSVRRALGASRPRLVRQLLTETIVLATAGAVFALIVAHGMSRALLAFLPPRYAPALVDLRFDVDLRILAFAVAAALLTSAAIGLLPALYSSRRTATAELRVRSGGSDRTRSWTSRGLIVTEIAICSLLLMVAGVFLRTVVNLRGQDGGYREAQLLVADLGFPRAYTEQRRDQLIEEMRWRVAALPDVESVGFSRIGQLTGGGIVWRIGFPDAAYDPAQAPNIPEERVSPGFLATMGTRLVGGRDFLATDTAQSPPVAMVNEAFAARFFPGASALGRRFFQDGGSQSGQLMEIVGIVQDVKWTNLRDPPTAMYYRPYKQVGGTSVVRLAVRTRGDLEQLAAMLIGTAQSADREMVLTNVVPFGEIVNRSLLTERLVAYVSGAFGALGLAIAAIGLYGGLAYSVTRRRREIGVRIAIGATPGSVERMFLRESFALFAIGLAIGVPLGIAVIRSIASMLYGVGPQDPSAIASVTAVLALATGAAAYLPARRAASIDPIDALRDE